MMTNLVLIYSKDPDFYMLMSHILATSGFEISPIDGLEAVLAAPLPRVIAILVDTSDAVESLASFCEEVKGQAKTARLPIVALIPARHEDNYLLLLKAGVDEVFMRPVSPERVLIYFQGLSGQHPRDTIPQSFLDDISRFGEIEIDHKTRLLRSGHRSAHLSPIKFSLFRRLLQTPGQVVSRAELIEAAWPDRGHVSARTVDVHIANLRRDIATTTRQTSIRTVRSSGYVLVAGQSSS